MKKLVLFLGVLFISLTQLMSQENSGTKVLISTSMGDITVLLYDGTPQHRDNFIKLVEDGFYTDLLFHRVITNFMIQGGDPDSRDAKPKKQLGNGGPGYTVPFEYDPQFYHKRGALAAARMPDEVNPGKESSGSQFYIVQGKVYTDAELDQIEVRMGFTFTPEQREVYKTIGGTPFLDRNYTVFGEVIEGMDVVDEIAGVERDKYDRPVQDVKFTITIITE
ncbi:MAG: peptidylprolyl isomerase [Marinilabiliales bacterium]|nr:MAG: peptidylprolyl isomerase [Marinilabiliales bacterium]